MMATAHPVWKNYSATQDGKIINNITKRVIKGGFQYGVHTIGLTYEGRRTTMSIQKFLEECFKSNIKQIPPHATVHPIFDGYYALASGEVYSKLSNRILSGYMHLGYVRLDLTTNRGRVSRFCHQVVYECFHGSVDGSLFDIDHIDGNKLNNKIDNLQKLTRQEHILKTVATVTKKRVRKWTVADATSTSEYWCCPINENWRHWEVSNTGYLKNKQGLVTQGSLTDGYFKTSVMGKLIRVHTVVATCFLGACPSTKHSVDHIDRNSENNAASNLRWATANEQASNMSHSRCVIAKDLQGQEKGKWPTIAAAARELKLHSANIQKVCVGKLTQTGGLKWSYA
jgi:hypothetical protein